MPSDTKSCKSCNRPIEVMCQQGTRFCSQNCEDAEKNSLSWMSPTAAIVGWEIPPHAV